MEERPDQSDTQKRASGKHQRRGPDLRGEASVPLDAAIERCWSGNQRGAADARETSSFAHTIETQVVPQLLALPGGEARAPRAAAEPGVVAAIAKAAVCGEPEVVRSYVLEYCGGGEELSSALLSLVAPAARLLGEDWERDRRDFMDVTVGLGTLQQVVSALSSDCLADAVPDRRILLGPTPGEHHTLGLAIVDHLFRAARWDVDFRPYADRQVLAEAVRETRFGVIGLSLSGDTLIEEAATTVRVLRAVSANAKARVIVGGPVFHRQRELAAYIGADALALDGPDAVAIADRWLAGGEAGRAL